MNYTLINCKYTETREGVIKLLYSYPYTDSPVDEHIIDIIDIVTPTANPEVVTAYLWGSRTFG